jgi:MoaA/NifB/PqqE/SkfB family radical SAM enzyme
VTFLATHRVAVQLSFDGLPAMQDLRARGSFARLDRLLDDVAATHPDFFRRRLSVAVTVAVEAVPHLAASIEYLLGKDVRRIEMAPAMGQRGWRARDAGALERQFDAIAAAGRRHRHRTGRTPMALMRRRAQEKPLLPPPGEWCCGVTSGGALVVDVDGRLYPCATLAQSCQRPDASPLGRRLAALQVGHVLDASLEDRWERLQGPARDARIFCRQDMKHSTGRACAGCRFLGECGVCPVASAHDPAVRSPTQVSDFLCAFSRASLSRLVS